MSVLTTVPQIRWSSTALADWLIGRGVKLDAVENGVAPDGTPVTFVAADRDVSADLKLFPNQPTADDLADAAAIARLKTLAATITAIAPAGRTPTQQAILDILRVLRNLAATGA